MTAEERLEQARAELEQARPSGYLSAFGAALEKLDGGLDWPYFLEKPWKWAGEYVAWLDADRPDYTHEIEWETFSDAVEELRR